MYFKTKWDTNAGNIKGNTSENKQGAGENPCKSEKPVPVKNKLQRIFMRQTMIVL